MNPIGALVGPLEPASAAVRATVTDRDDERMASALLAFAISGMVRTATLVLLSARHRRQTDQALELVAPAPRSLARASERLLPALSSRHFGIADRNGRLRPWRSIQRQI
jgi:hypothetical protein